MPTSYDAADYFAQLESLSGDQWAESAGDGSHLPDDPDYAPLDVEARVIEMEADDRFAIEVAERISYVPTGEVSTSYTVSVATLTERVVTFVDYGTLSEPASLDEILPLSDRLKDRITRELG